MQAAVVVKGNPVVHSSHPDEVGHGSVEVDVATWTDLQPHGAVTNLSMMQKAELQL